jgi:hypothetical protein
MNRRVCFVLPIAFWAAINSPSRSAESTPAVTEVRTGDPSSVSDQSMMRDLFDRWEKVWHEGQFDLVPGCVWGTLHSA